MHLAMAARSTRSLLLIVFLQIGYSNGQVSVESHGQKTGPAEDHKLYIVYLGANHPDPSRIDGNLANHHTILSSVLGSLEKAKASLVYSYKRSFNGFAAKISSEHASFLSDHPDVVSVIRSKRYKLQTTTSWRFMGLNMNEGVWPASKFGGDAIVGIMDSGVWPESESFKDDGLGPIPSRWKGSCEESGEDFGPAHCNKKLIGARYYDQGAAGHGLLYSKSARDADGHGTHTASTAAGSRVTNASLEGLARGTAAGTAFGARVAIYKVCLTFDCIDVDVLAAFDDAIHDGVDVLNLSFGDGSDPTGYMSDVISIGSFHAVQKGIVVSCAAGNDGRGGVAMNIAPWVITVGATTMNRNFLSRLTLGDGRSYEGQVLNFKALKEPTKLYPIVSAHDITPANRIACGNDALDRTFVRNKIVLCGFDVGETDQNVAAVGGVGMVLVDDSLAQGGDDGSNSYVLPTTLITTDLSQEIQAYINSTMIPTANIAVSETIFNPSGTPLVAGFSSRGPNFITPHILKPDIGAPGVDILAAWSPRGPIEDGEGDDARLFGFNWNIISGTSMAAPHVTGVAAMLKSLHPDWSPSAIKSAIMTTASSLDEKYQRNLRSILAVGAGQINPTQAADPGLIYNISIDDYIAFLCALNESNVDRVIGNNSGTTCNSTLANHSALDLNYPTISIISFSNEFTTSNSSSNSVLVRRTVTNVGDSNSIYRVLIETPPEVKEIIVKPSTLSFVSSGQTQAFTVEIIRNLDSNVTLVPNVFSFGSITWTNGKHNVRSVISIGNASNRSLKLKD